MTIAELKTLSPSTPGNLTKVEKVEAQIIEVTNEIKQRISKSTTEPYQVQKIRIADTTGQISLWSFYRPEKAFATGQIVKVSGTLYQAGNTKYLDYCTLTVQGVSSPQQPVQQQAQQTQQQIGNAFDAQKPQQHYEQKEQAKSRSIERQAAFKAACRRAQGTDMSLGQIIELAQAGHTFITANWTPDELPPTPDDIPV